MAASLHHAEHRPGSRRRSGQGRVLHRDGVHPWRRPAHAAVAADRRKRATTCRSSTCPIVALAAAWRCTTRTNSAARIVRRSGSSIAMCRPRTSRRLRRQREGRRLRHREGGPPVDRDEIRHAQGEDLVHGARAMPRAAGRSPKRRVRARHRAVRAVHGAAVVQGVERLPDDVGDRVGPRAAPIAASPRFPPAREHHHEGAVAVAGGPLSNRRRDARRARSRRVCARCALLDDGAR